MSVFNYTIRVLLIDYRHSKTLIWSPLLRTIHIEMKEAAILTNNSLLIQSIKMCLTKYHDYANITLYRVAVENQS